MSCINIPSTARAGHLSIPETPSCLEHLERSLLGLVFSEASASQGLSVPDTFTECIAPSIVKGHSLISVNFCVFFNADPSRETLTFLGVFSFFLGGLIYDNTIKLCFIVTFPGAVSGPGVMPPCLPSGHVEISSISAVASRLCLPSLSEAAGTSAGRSLQIPHHIHFSYHSLLSQEVLSSDPLLREMKLSERKLKAMIE